MFGTYNIIRVSDVLVMVVKWLISFCVVSACLCADGLNKNSALKLDETPQSYILINLIDVDVLK